VTFRSGKALGTTPTPDATRSGDFLQKSFDDGCFSYSRLAGDRHQRPATVSSSQEGSPEGVQFAVASNDQLFPMASNVPMNG
jgi:hypothetical protein